MIRGRSLAFIFLSCAVGDSFAQTAPQVLSRIEPGLEEAVRWKWEVEAAPALPDPQPVPRPDVSLLKVPEKPSEPATAGEGGGYVVKKGDALVKIARKFQITVEQLKIANDLKGDLIRVGDVLRIPDAEEVARMPAPTPRPGTRVAPVPQGAAGRMSPALGGYEEDVLTMQIALDRRGFSPGPIDGRSGLRFQGLMMGVQRATGQTPEVILQKARADVQNPFTTYTLTADDFRWIRPPMAVSKKAAPEARLQAAFRELTGHPEALYRSAWEFVAERYHCDESFLRRLNPTLKSSPSAGAVFRVPNVTPFLIESDAAVGQRPPAAEGDGMVVAVVADLAWLEIYRGEEMVACFPLTVARPGLRGRGEWVLKDSVARPRLTTRREPSGGGVPPADAKTEIIGPGPRNPVGVHWIHLARAGENEPLPFGLHGTSVPDRMSSTESLGGFRLTNWDIVRAARLLPVGTTLRWRRTIPPKVVPAAAPAAEVASPDASPAPAADGTPGESPAPEAAVENAQPTTEGTPDASPAQ